MSDLPPGWEWATLGDVGQVQGGIQKQAKRRPVLNKYPFLRVANVSGGVLNLSEVHEIELFEGEIEKYRLQAGDLLVVEGNGSLSQLGRATMWRGQLPNCVHQNHLIRVRPYPGIEPAYLLHIWNSDTVRAQLERLGASTSGLHTLSVSKLLSIQLPIPPTSEQTRIITALEDHLSRLGAGREYLSKGELRLKAMTQAVFDSVASGAIFSGKKESGDELAKGWTWAKVDEVTSGQRSDVTIGPFGSNLKVSDYRDSGVPLIFVRNIRSNSYDGPKTKFVSPEKADELSAHEVLPGDLLITKMGDPPGDAGVYNGTCAGIITADCIRLRPSPDFRSDYLAIAVNSRIVREQIAQITRGVAQKKVSLQRFRKEIRLPVPSRELQDSVMVAAKELLDEIQRVSRATETVQHRAENLRRSLLTEAFLGHLVFQEPADEPASVLLERIRSEQAEQSKLKRTLRTKNANQETLL